MSEERTSQATQNNQATDSVNTGPDLVADQQSPGTILKRAREARGLHIAALAVLLKVPVKKLEALESDRFDLLPDAVFARALASSVCRTLKIDPITILARLPQTDAPRLVYQGMSINAPFRMPGDRTGPPVWEQVSRPAVLAGLLLLLGAMVLIFLPLIKTGISSVKLEKAHFGIRASTPKTETKTSPVALPESDSSIARIAGVSPDSPPLTNIGTPVVSASAGVVNMTAPIAGSSLAEKSTVADIRPNSSPISSSNGSAVTTSSTITAKAIAVQASDVVMFTAKAESWVEVTDARGQIVLRRVLAPGEVVGASGALPLKVVVGRADATQVQIRGKAFDSSALAKDNVARFEVK